MPYSDPRSPLSPVTRIITPRISSTASSMARGRIILVRHANTPMPTRIITANTTRASCSAGVLSMSLTSHNGHPIHRVYEPTAAVRTPRPCRTNSPPSTPYANWAIRRFCSSSTRRAATRVITMVTRDMSAHHRSAMPWMGVNPVLMVNMPKMPAPRAPATANHGRMRTTRSGCFRAITAATRSAGRVDMANTRCVNSMIGLSSPRGRICPK